MENERTEAVKKYIEELGAVPETLLSIGMIGPIILAIVGLSHNCLVMEQKRLLEPSTKA